MKIIPFEFQKIFVITLFADKIVFAFFGGASADFVHYLGCCLFSGVWWTQVSSTVKNSLEFRLNSAKFSVETIFRRNFWSIVSKRGTHLTQSFSMHKCWCKILWTHSVDIPVVSAISLTFNLRSSRTILCIFSIISPVGTSIRRPDPVSSSVLVRLFLNSEIHCLTVDDGEEFISVESISSLIWIGVKPFK